MKTTRTTKTTTGGIQITAADLATPAPRKGESFLDAFAPKSPKPAPKPYGGELTEAGPGQWTY